jgi:hypothetical protein
VSPTRPPPVPPTRRPSRCGSAPSRSERPRARRDASPPDMRHKSQRADQSAWNLRPLHGPQVAAFTNRGHGMSQHDERRGARERGPRDDGGRRLGGSWRVRGATCR